MLERLGAATTRPSAANVVRSARLDLLPVQALSSLRTVVDVGANEGAWSRAVLTVARPERLIAVEPSPLMRARLQTTIGKRPAVEIVEAAVHGSERDVIAGGSATLSKTRWLLIEANLRSHSESDLLLPELHEPLVQAGFELAGLSPPRIEGGVALWCDALYGAAR